MSDALPALVRGLINSVIAPAGKQPPMSSSRKGKLITKRVADMAGGWGKRSASNFRRSIILSLAAMENKHGVSLLYVQVNSLPYPAQAGLLNKAEFFFSKRLARAIACQRTHRPLNPTRVIDLPTTFHHPTPIIRLPTSHFSHFILLSQCCFRRSCLRISDTITP